MEDQDSILNELLERIKTIENSNESLRLKIVQKKKELAKMSLDESNPKVNNNTDKTDKSKKEATNTKLKTIPTEKEDETAGQKALANYKSIKMNQANIKYNCVEYVIEYKSQEQHSKLFIMGDFTKWEMTPMKKTKDIFSYKVILLKGFKYYYSFQAGDQILLDYDAPFEENPKNFQVQNYIDLNEPNKNLTFDSENDINILKISEQNYNLAQLDLKEDEFLFLNKLKHHVTVTKQLNKEEREKRDKLISSINSYFYAILQYVNPHNNINHMYQIRLYLKNKILSKYSDDGKIIYHYKILIISDTYIFQCVKLYDSNHIKVNTDSYSYSGFYFNVVPSQITFKKIEPNSKLYHLLSNEESQKILDEYKKDDKSILVAHFKTLLNLKNNAVNNAPNNENIYGFRRNIIFVTPKKLEPEGIKVDDYEFYYSLNRITKVKNKKDGSEVMYKIIDESIEKNKKPNRYEIYYGIINGKIFLIHCHVLDKDLHNIKMKVKDIKPDEDPKILKKNDDYINNNQLLLITQGPKILKLYYKGKKVKTLIVRVEEKRLYLLQSPNPDSIFHRMYVTIQNFSEKIKYDLIEQCSHFTYSLDNMPNGVDIQVEFDSQKNRVTEPMMLSVSPCLLKTITHYDEHFLKEKMPKNEEDKNQNDFNDMSAMSEMEKYFAIAQKMVALRKYKNKENLDKLKQDEKNNLIKELDGYNKAMDIILIYIEANEMWENIDEAMSIKTEINDLIKLLK